MNGPKKDQLGIGPFWRKLEESGQKWILEPLFSEICGQSIAKDLNLWSTLIFVRFEKLFFSDF